MSKFKRLTLKDDEKETPSSPRSRGKKQSKKKDSKKDKFPFLDDAPSDLDVLRLPWSHYYNRPLASPVCDGWEVYLDWLLSKAELVNPFFEVSPFRIRFTHDRFRQPTTTTTVNRDFGLGGFVLLSTLCLVF